MRRAGVGAFAVVAVLALAALLVTTIADDRRLAFTLGVQPAQPVDVLEPGEQACQAPIDVPADADIVQFPVRTEGGAGPPLVVSVRDVAARSTLGRARVAGGYPDGSTVAARVGGLEEGRRVAVCVRDAGASVLALFGGPAQAARTSDLFVDGRPANADMTLVFERAEAKSMASLVPDAIERAALFTAGWVSPVLLWVLGAAFLLGVPLLLALALARAGEDPAR